MIITLIYLIYAIALTIIIVIFTVITLGAFQMASTHTLAKSMLDAQQFNHDIIPYVLYIFVSAIIIKNILFNVELHKFLKNSNIVTRK